MIEQVTINDLYSRSGFESMVEEYSELAIKTLPKPLFRQEDYLRLESLGILTVWCVMDDDLVVGFAICLMSMIPHYGIRIGIAESLFVRRGWRHIGAGIRLIEAVERCAASKDAVAVFFSCPLGSEFERVLEHRNYSAETTTFVKSLRCSQLH